MIAYENRDIDKHPFVYVIMIINESNLDGVLDKYVLKLEYNFIKKTTNAILGETEYVNEVMLAEETVSDIVKLKSNIDTKNTAYNAAFTEYDTANKAYPYDIIEWKKCEENYANNCKDHKNAKQEACTYNDTCATTCASYDKNCVRQINDKSKTEYSNKLSALKELKVAEGALNGAKDLLSAALSVHQFSYFDLGRMQSKKFENINKGLISDKKYKYICMTPDNKILKTEAARELAAFVRDFGANNKTSIYPISKMLNAMEQSRQ
jgi:hypothetical protein